MSYSKRYYEELEMAEDADTYDAIYQRMIQEAEWKETEQQKINALILLNKMELKLKNIETWLSQK